MPWCGPTPERPFPSLGYELADLLDEWFPDEPLIDDQADKLIHFYRLTPDGRRAYRRGQLMGPKGVGKSPEGARWSLVEFAGPVLFDGWDADGEPVGKTWAKPLVQIAAVSEDQTDNTYGALLELLTDDDGRVADLLGLDAGQTRILRRDQPAARIDAVTSSAGTREGQRVTFGLLDETHLWYPSNGGPKLVSTIRRNAGKMGGTTVETTNAYDPAMLSVAQATDEAAAAGTKGIWQWKPQAPHVESLANTRDVKRALKKVYGGAHWIDQDRLIEEMHDPDTTEEDARRFYLNEIVKGAGRAVDPKQWHSGFLDVEVQDGEPICLGFDGARSDDTTALVGCRFSDGMWFEIEAWARPAGAGDEWMVPADEVDAVVKATMKRFQVARAYGDPPYWEDLLASWCGLWPDVWRYWYTNREKPMVHCLRRIHTRLQSGEHLQSSGEDGWLTQHALHAVRRPSRVRDDKGRPMWTVGKETAHSPLKIDGFVAGALADEARADALAAGWQPKRRGVRIAAF